MKMLYLTLLFLTLSLRGISCTCFKIPIDSSFAYTPLVFEGRVMSQYEDVFFHENAEYSLITNLEIIKDYKGTQAKNIITIVGGLGCDFSFKEGETYIVFAYQRGEGIYTSNFCSGTKISSQFDSLDMQVIEKLSQRYYNEFDLMYRIWSDEKSKKFIQSEPDRILRLAYSTEKKKNQIYKYVLIALGIWSIVCTGILVSRKKITH